MKLSFESESILSHIKCTSLNLNFLDSEYNYLNKDFKIIGIKTKKTINVTNSNPNNLLIAQIPVQTFSKLFEFIAKFIIFLMELLIVTLFNFLIP